MSKPDEFRIGEIAILTYGRWKDRDVEIVDGLEPRVEMIIGGYRAEGTNYRVMMPSSEIWSVGPEFLRKKPSSAAIDANLRSERAPAP